MLNELSCAVSKTSTETLSPFPGIQCTAWGVGFSLLLQHPFRIWRFLPCAKGIATGWCLHDCVHAGRIFQEQQRVSYAIKVLQCLLLSSFLHVVLGKILGENECWQPTGIGQCLEGSREMCCPSDKGTGGGKGEDRRLVRSQTGIRSHRWTEATCPTNSSSFLLKIRSRFTHLFSSWVQTQAATQMFTGHKGDTQQSWLQKKIYRNDSKLPFTTGSLERQ